MNYSEFIENTVKKTFLQNIQCNISNKGKKHVTTAFHKRKFNLAKAASIFI